MTAGRKKKIGKIIGRLDDIAGELVGIAAVERDAGGIQDRNAETYKQIEAARDYIRRAALVLKAV